MAKIVEREFIEQLFEGDWPQFLMASRACAHRWRLGMENGQRLAAALFEFGELRDAIEFGAGSEQRQLIVGRQERIILAGDSAKAAQKAVSLGVGEVREHHADGKSVWLRLPVEIVLGDAGQDCS